MGFSTILDIVGSVITGGLLLLILFKLNTNATSNVYNTNSEANVQEAMVSVVEVLESDFRKIGYCKSWDKIPDPSKSILYADSSDIKFLTDIDNNGIIDTVHYYLGPTSELSGTPNPNDRKLYRVIDDELPKTSNVGITSFKLTYINTLGDTLKVLPVAQPGEIHTIQIDLQVQNTEAVDSVYTTAFWRQIRLSAKNLQNR